MKLFANDGDLEYAWSGLITIAWLVVARFPIPASLERKRLVVLRLPSFQWEYCINIDDYGWLQAAVVYAQGHGLHLMWVVP